MATRNNGGCGKMCPHTGQNREKTAYRYVLKFCLIDDNIWFHKTNDLDFSNMFKKMHIVPSKLTYIKNEKFQISKSLLEELKYGGPQLPRRKKKGLGESRNLTAKVETLRRK